MNKQLMSMIMNKNTLLVVALFIVAWKVFNMFGNLKKGVTNIFTRNSVQEAEEETKRMKVVIDRYNIKHSKLTTTIPKIEMVARRIDKLFNGAFDPFLTEYKKIMKVLILFKTEDKNALIKIFGTRDFKPWYVIKEKQLNLFGFFDAFVPSEETKELLAKQFYGCFIKYTPK